MTTCCRFGRLTVVTLESKLEAREKEVEQLTRALEKTDEHMNSLENELQTYRSAVSTGDSVTGTSSLSAADDDVERDTGDSDTVVSSCNDIRQPTDDRDTTNESCRKKLRFTTHNCN